MPGDRRDPVARYVQFSDALTQEQFTDLAEDVFQRAAALHPWTGAVSLELAPPAVVADGKRRFRKAREVSHPGETLVLTAALAAAGRTALEAPVQMREMDGCEAGKRIAAAMGEVILDIARDLADLTVEEERDHPAARQALRLGAELQAVRDITSKSGCTDESGCVQLRSPAHWGRRLEDVEVNEVRSVLAQLSEHLH